MATTCDENVSSSESMTIPPDKIANCSETMSTTLEENVTRSKNIATPNENATGSNRIATPTDENATDYEKFATITNENASDSERMATTPGENATHSERMTNITDVNATGSGIIAATPDEYTTGSVKMATISDENATGSVKMANPPEEISTDSERMTTSPKENASAAESLTTTPDENVTNSDIIATSLNENETASERMTILLDGNATGSEKIASPPDENTTNTEKNVKAPDDSETAVDPDSEGTESCNEDRMTNIPDENATGSGIIAATPDQNATDSERRATTPGDNATHSERMTNIPNATGSGIIAATPNENATDSERMTYIPDENATGSGIIAATPDENTTGSVKMATTSDENITGSVKMANPPEEISTDSERMTTSPKENASAVESLTTTLDENVTNSDIIATSLDENETDSERMTMLLDGNATGSEKIALPLDENPTKSEKIASPDENTTNSEIIASPPDDNTTNSEKNAIAPDENETAVDPDSEETDSCNEDEFLTEEQNEDQKPNNCVKQAVCRKVTFAEQQLPTSTSSLPTLSAYLSERRRKKRTSKKLTITLDEKDPYKESDEENNILVPHSNKDTSKRKWSPPPLENEGPQILESYTEDNMAKPTVTSTENITDNCTKNHTPECSEKGAKKSRKPKIIDSSMLRRSTRPRRPTKASEIYIGRKTPKTKKDTEMKTKTRTKEPASAYTSDKTSAASEVNIEFVGFESEENALAYLGLGATQTRRDVTSPDEGPPCEPWYDKIKCLKQARNCDAIKSNSPVPQESECAPASEPKAGPGSEPEDSDSEEESPMLMSRLYQATMDTPLDEEEDAFVTPDLDFLDRLSREPDVRQAFDGAASKDFFHFDWTPFLDPPIPPKDRRETFTQKDVGPTDRCEDPYDIFVKIWDAKIMNRIEIETNKHAQEIYPKSRTCAWKNTDVDELYTYFAIILAMGIVIKSKPEEYWRNDGDIFTTPGFRAYMQQARFQLLNSCLHFNKNQNMPRELSAAEARLFKIEPIVNHLNSKFQSMYAMGQNIAVDQTLVQGKVGVRSHEVWEAPTGYLWRFTVSAIEQADQEQQNPLAAVRNLLRGLERKGHTVWMNDFYNSPALARLLKTLGFDVAGTLRTNRQFVPEELCCLTKENMRKNEIAALTSGDVDLMVWRDVNCIATISTYHGNQTAVVDGKIKPCVVLDYFYMMNGVDKKDKKLAKYPIERSNWVNRVWYKSFFRRLLNVSVLNAFIIAKKSGSPLGHRDFRMKLIDALLSRHCVCGEVVQAVQVPRVARVRAGRIYMANRHYIQNNPKGTNGTRLRRVCCVCKHRTQNYCAGCKKTVCMGKCFVKLHPRTS